MRVHFQDSLKQSPLEPDDMFYRKQKHAGLSQKSFTFMVHALFYAFIKDVFQNSWRTTAPINSAPEIIFAGCNKENPNVPRR